MRKAKKSLRVLTKAEANKVKGGSLLSFLFGNGSSSEQNTSSSACCPPPEPSYN